MSHLFYYMSSYYENNDKMTMIYETTVVSEICTAAIVNARIVQQTYLPRLQETVFTVRKSPLPAISTFIKA